MRITRRVRTVRNIRLVWVLAAFVSLACIAPLCARLYISAVTSQRRYVVIATVPARHVALVFGAGLLPDGSPTPMLADRVDAAVELYRAGKVMELLFSGDNSRPEYNEVGAMFKYAVERGVPGSAITLDYAGFDTYDSCYRAHAIFGVTSAILVTQRYHLPRAVYDCTMLGIDAVGVGTPDWGAYGDSMMAGYEVRETVADVKSLWDINVSHRPATLTGAYLGMH
ncbi:MAG TPA: ElyC/SanA/YdcF family protein [Candidatus Eremiobacteraceae bacterium]|nr:ElyC/SanA/YdcF family protein [Candidatus Eremiobacteraceae bacterium]